MRLIDADALDDLICQLNEEGHEITRNEYKMIDNILFEFPTVDVLEQIRAEIMQLDTYYDNDYFSGNKDAMFKCNDVLKIIDKYK